MAIQNVWGQIFSEKGLPQNNTYVVSFGNSEWGEEFTTKEDLKTKYRDLLRRAWFQDICIFYNGTLIRSISHMDAKITGKLMSMGLAPSEIIYTQYRKFPYESLEVQK